MVEVVDFRRIWWVVVSFLRLVLHGDGKFETREGVGGNLIEGDECLYFLKYCGVKLLLF